MSIHTSGEYEERGRGLLGAGRASEALALFEEGCRKFPGDQDLLMGTAMALLKLARFEDACTVLEELKRGHPSSEVLRALVEGYLGRGLLEDAKAAADEAAKADDAREIYAIARSFYGRGRYRESFPLYERAAEVAPDWSEAWFGLGACEWAMKRPAAAEAALRRAIELAPEDWQARQFLGCVLCDQGRKEEARAMLESVPLDAPWQKPALERLVAVSWWPTDPKRSRQLETLWRRVMGGAPPTGALDVLAEVSRKMDER
jgi:tetratricopeptide (TPR) repeat protein